MNLNLGRNIGRALAIIVSLLFLGPVYITVFGPPLTPAGSLLVTFTLSLAGLLGDELLHALTDKLFKKEEPPKV